MCLTHDVIKSIGKATNTLLRRSITLLLAMFLFPICAVAGTILGLMYGIRFCWMEVRACWRGPLDTI